jgi:hypothetical protein
VGLFQGQAEVTSATGYDPGHEQWSWPPSGKYDFVQCAFVLNVIEDRAERVQVLKTVKGLLRADGRALIATRSPEEVAAHVDGVKLADGVVTRKGTFQRGFTRNELANLAKRAGLRVLSNQRFSIRLPKRVTWIVVAR